PRSSAANGCVARSDARQTFPEWRRSRAEDRSWDGRDGAAAIVTRPARASLNQIRSNPGSAACRGASAPAFAALAGPAEASVDVALQAPEHVAERARDSRQALRSNDDQRHDCDDDDLAEGDVEHGSADCGVSECAAAMRPHPRQALVEVSFLTSPSMVFVPIC